MTGLERAQMGRDDLRQDALLVVLAQHHGNDAGCGERGDGRAHGKAAQHRAAGGLLALRLRHRGFDPGAQACRRCVAQIGVGQHALHLALGCELGSAVRAAGDMSFDLARVAGIELVVEQRVKQDPRFVAGHLACSSSAFQAARSMARARARRDITVPTGAPTASAISR
jgi:hypothetical protein